jgi:hypothetical protein
MKRKIQELTYFTLYKLRTKFGWITIRLHGSRVCEDALAKRSAFVRTEGEKEDL